MCYGPFREVKVDILKKKKKINFTHLELTEFIYLTQSELKEKIQEATSENVWTWNAWAWKQKQSERKEGSTGTQH